MRTAYFHEDEYCQWEILPLLAKEFCLKEMGDISAFSEEHRDGDYYTAVYVRDECPHGIEELSLRSEQLDEALSFLPAYDKVESGNFSSTYTVKLYHTRGRGDGPRKSVFWDVNESGLVEALWLDLDIWPENREVWQRILDALGQLAPVLLADWGWKQCVNLTSPQEIEQYIKDKVTRTIQVQENIKRNREAGDLDSTNLERSAFTSKLKPWANRCLACGILSLLFGIGQIITEPILMNTNRDNILLTGFFLYGMPLITGIFGIFGIGYYLISDSSKIKVRRIIGLVLSLIGILLDLFLQ